MALARTTLSAAVGLNDDRVLVASLTGIAAGSYLRIDQEIMRVVSVPSAATVPVPVLRGQEGSKQTTHTTTSGVVVGLGSEMAAPVAGAASIVPYPAVRNRTMVAMAVTGVIPLPTPGNDLVVVLNGTTVIAGTLPVPGLDQDGDRILIVGNGLAAHTVTVTGGAGAVGATADVFTFKADQRQALEFVAANGVWITISIVAGAATVAGVGVA